MLHYFIERLGVTVILGLFVSFVSFVLLFASGDPATRIAGEGGTVLDADLIRAQLGLDRPILMQYTDWLFRFVQGDLGTSSFFSQPVLALIADRFETTLMLGSAAIILALSVAVPLGVAAGLRPNSVIDRLCLLIAVVGQAMPTFWLALMLVVVFGVMYPVFPTSGSDTWQHFVLPTIVLAYFAMPAIMRLTRAGVMSVWGTDYIRTARAMGIRSWRVLFVYVLRNAIIPVVSLSAAQFGYMLSGSVVVESVFAIRGAGRLAWESIQRGDLPTVQALVVCFCFLYVFLTLIADVVNAWLDPRLRV